MKLKTILEDLDKLTSLSKIKLPIKVSYWVSRILSKVNSELKSFQEQRNKLIEEYGEQDEKTKQFTVKDPEKLKVFSKEINELLDVEVELDVKKISIKDLGAITIEPELLLNWIFIE
ncbi:hypothetical protein M0R04_13675 [Candidatus Dojkabacteria bacterium]|jgi:hypothetical protein|nr:hypothetical protein [Candidatus Dojkabacteria bacterium]